MSQIGRHICTSGLSGKEKVSHLMLMNSGNEILGGRGLRAQPLLAAFHRVKRNRSNMLTDVDMPVALATSDPVFVAAARNIASGCSPICCTDCSICLHLFFCASSLSPLSFALPLLSFSDYSICHYLFLLYVHNLRCCRVSAKFRVIALKYSFTCEKLFH